MAEATHAGQSALPLSYRQALAQATGAIAALPQASPSLEAELLLAFVLGRPRSHLYAWPDNTLTAEQQAAFLALVRRRRAGEPLAYITGQREFWSLTLAVTPATLIPRPETETLVEWALECLLPGRRTSVADLGTGCGAVAAAIASERPLAAVLATDISTAALAVAEANFRRLGLTNVASAQGSWTAALPDKRRFELIVSNPPYVAETDPHLKQGDLPHEPAGALASGSDGLRDIGQIIRQAGNHLSADGWLLMEHGFDQGAAVRRLLLAAGYRQVATRQDLETRDRVSGGMRGET